MTIQNSMFNGFMHFWKFFGKEYNSQEQDNEESPCCVVAHMTHCDIVISKFVLQSSYYIPFLTNTPGKGMNPFISPPKP